MTRAALPTYYCRKQPTLVQDFDTLVDFTTAGTGATFAVDSSIKTVGNGSLAVTAGAAAATADFTISPSLSFGQQREPSFLLRVYSPSDASLTSIILYLSTSAGFGAGTWASATLTLYDGVRSQAQFKSGWNNILVRRSNFAGGTPSVLDDPTKIFTICRVRIEASRGPIYWDGLWVDVVSRPKVVVMFDDQHETIMQANGAVFGSSNSPFDYMESKGIKGSLYVNPDNVGAANYLTEANLSTLYAAGWDLCNHTMGHTALTTLSDAEIFADLSECKGWLDARGFTRASNHFSYPIGAFTLDTHPALLRSLGYKTARSIQATLLNTQYECENLHYLWAKGVGTGVSAADVTTKIDDAILNGRMFGTYIHSLSTPETTYVWDPAKFKTVIDYIYRKQADGLLDAATISEWYDGLAGRRLPVSRLSA